MRHSLQTECANANKDNQERRLRRDVNMELGVLPASESISEPISDQQLVMPLHFQKAHCVSSEVARRRQIATTMISSKQILILGIILLSSSLLAFANSCGDGTCNENESCESCPSDCSCPKAIGVGSSVALTYYWISWEEDYPRTNLNTELKTCTRQTIASVSSSYADKVRMEGTGRLADGRMINLGGCGCGSGYTCFQLLDSNQFPYGMGSRSNPLLPFVSVAANDLPYGKKYYVSQFDGMRLPNGKRHNGCVRVDDTGWSFGNNQIDFFALRESYYDTLDNQMGLSRVNIQEADCTVIDYLANTTTTAPSPSPAPVAPSSAPSNAPAAPSTLPSVAPSFVPPAAPSANPDGSTVCWSNVYSTIPKAGTVTFSIRYNAATDSTLSVQVVRLSDSSVVGRASAQLTAKASVIGLPTVMNGSLGSGYVVRVTLTPNTQPVPVASVDYPVSLGLTYVTNSAATACRSA